MYDLHLSSLSSSFLDVYNFYLWLKFWLMLILFEDIFKIILANNLI